MRYLLLLLLMVLQPAWAATSDYAREKKLADEIVPGVVVGDAQYLDAQGHKFLALYTEAPNGKAGLVIVHGIGVHPDHGLIGVLRSRLACPTDAVVMNERGEPIIDPEECLGCAKCVKVCPAEAVVMVATESGELLAAEPAEEDAWQPEAGVPTAAGYQGVWVFVEQDQGTAHSVSGELLGVGRTLAGDQGVELAAFVLGSNVSPLAQEAFGYGADRVYVVDDPVLARYRTPSYLRATVGLIRKYRPEIVLMGATSLGRDLAGAVATQLEAGLTADCTGLAIDKQRRLLEQTRPAFGGNIALGRCVSSEIAAYAVVVDAKDDGAVAFYEHHGFIQTRNPPRAFFLPLATAKGVRPLAR